MSYKKQLPVALPGHGCAARKSHDSEKKTWIFERQLFTDLFTKIQKQVFHKKRQIANNFYAKILTTNIDT